MKRTPMIAAVLRSCALVLGLLAIAAPAMAQWTRVAEVPVTRIFAVSVRGDTILAGGTNVAYVSTDAGASWQTTKALSTPSQFLQTVLVQNGKLYAGTTRQGVFISSDLGQSWAAFNQGLVGGLFDSQLDVADLQVRGDTLYAATLGAGVYVRNLRASPGAWSHFGEAFEPEQASNVLAIGMGGSRLVAAAGGNGTTFFRDAGALDWTESLLGNIGLHPGLQADRVAFTGTGWVVSAEAGRGVFLSVTGQEPWTFVNVGLGIIDRTALALRGHQLFAAFDLDNDAVIETSGDDGASWEVLEVLPGVFVEGMAVSGNVLYAGRLDGLWRRESANASVPAPQGAAALRFALVGRQPAADAVRVRFELPEAAEAAIDVFDITGRRMAEPVRQSFAAGAHEVAWNAADLSPGVYLVHLRANGNEAALRLVLVR